LVKKRWTAKDYIPDGKAECPCCGYEIMISKFDRDMAEEPTDKPWFKCKGCGAQLRIGELKNFKPLREI